MAVLKYPFYIAGIVFAVLSIYSVSTEKPRQYKAKPIAEEPFKSLDVSPPSETAAITTARVAPPTEAGKGSSASSNSTGSTNAPKQSSEPTPTAQNVANPLNTSNAAPANVVIGYSNNDAGGKMVLTLNRCEKSAGSVAYTTAPDGKVDYGCWNFDELFIVIKWEKAGINNYTYDRFVDYTTNERLTPKQLFAATQKPIATIPNAAAPNATTQGTVGVSSTPAAAISATSNTPRNAIGVKK